MRNRKKSIPVIDIFAGPGGLGEGFSAVDQDRNEEAFRIVLSIEKDRCAYNTLKLRSFFRKFPDGQAPENYYKLEYNNYRKDFNYDQLFAEYSKISEEVDQEVKLRELGDVKVSEGEIDNFIQEALEKIDHDHWVLIGGPPCQAYSTVGRSRNKGNKEYIPENDNRHFLYKEYLRIIAAHWPSIFVMENVKGILTAQINGKPIFKQILADLRDPADAVHPLNLKSEKYQYRIFSFIKHPVDYDEKGFPFYKRPADFVIESEKFGIPQARHRVILLGIREDINIDSREILKENRKTITVADVIKGLPKLRSYLSKEEDSAEKWQKCILGVMNSEWLANKITAEIDDDTREMIFDALEFIGKRLPESDKGGETIAASYYWRLKE